MDYILENEYLKVTVTTAKAAVQLSENCVIEHERFGVGKVLRVEGSGENTKATVQFSNVGVKQLLLKFARFKVIGWAKKPINEEKNKKKRHLCKN